VEHARLTEVGVSMTCMILSCVRRRQSKDGDDRRERQCRLCVNFIPEETHVLATRLATVPMYHLILLLPRLLTLKLTAWVDLRVVTTCLLVLTSLRQCFALIIWVLLAMDAEPLIERVF
jgi:hypothetical protein